MRDGEWCLLYPGTEFIFGTRATPVFNLSTPDLGDVDLRVDDVDRPRSDGRAFGVDFRGAQTISFDLGIRGTSETDVRRQAAALRQAWRADAVRTVPGVVAELHATYAGEERVCYGRPRRFAPNYSDAATNALVTVTADFACVDDVFYGAVEQSQAVSFVPTLGGGFAFPFAFPMTTQGHSTDRSTRITVATDLPAWPIIEINGPISSPVVEVAGVFAISLSNTTLAHDDTVIIDTRPWARTALLNGAGNLSGALRGTRLAKAAIPSGTYEVALRGVDVTGTSSARLRWRPAHPTL